MKDRILCVDDEVSVLQAQKRLLRKYFDVVTAESGEKGLECITNQGPFSVVISDMRMPGMDGIKFLSKVKILDSNAVRMMLTGDQDLSTAENAVNEGNIFRFLRKPCPPEVIAKAIKAAIEQYHLIIAEREVLEKTLNQTVKALIDILEIASPQAFCRTSRIQKYAQQIVDELKIKFEKPWEMEIIPFLFSIGCISIPEHILIKAFNGKKLNPDEMDLYEKHPLTGYEQLIKIPRMADVAKIVKYQNKGYDGSGFPYDDVSGEEIPLPSRILKFILDYDDYLIQGMSPHDTVRMMKDQGDRYDPKLFHVLEKLFDIQVGYESRELQIDELKAGMILAEALKTESGTILASKGQELTKINIKRIYSFSLHSNVVQPIKVLVIRGA